MIQYVKQANKGRFMLFIFSSDTTRMKNVFTVQEVLLKLSGNCSLCEHTVASSQVYCHISGDNGGY